MEEWSIATYDAEMNRLRDEIDKFRAELERMRWIEDEHRQMCKAVGRDTVDGRALDDIMDLGIELEAAKAELEAVKAERDEYMAALMNIKVHQELIAGGMARTSVVWLLASAALQPEGDDNGK
jgi:hypothetical protein